MRPIGLAALTVLELAPPDMVSAAAAGGYSHVGLRLIPATEQEVRHPIVGDTPMVRETQRRLGDTGVRVLDVELFRMKPETIVADYRATLETAARFGATHALVAGNDPEFARFVERFAAFCDLAGEYGIAASVEPMPWTDVRDFATGVRAVVATGKANAAIVVDPIHFDRAGDVASALDGVPRTMFRYAQICDAPAARPSSLDEVLRQARQERLLPGEGGLDLAGILRRLPRDLPLSVEIPNQRLAQHHSPAARAKLAHDATVAYLARLDAQDRAR